MLDRPYLLDLRRNPVASLDLPGGVSPPPGLFRSETAEEAVAYFRGLGYSWLAAIRPERSHGLYERRVWDAHERGDRLWKFDPRTPGPGASWAGPSCASSRSSMPSCGAAGSPTTTGRS
jgi:hypothetical protein